MTFLPSKPSSMASLDIDHLCSIMIDKFHFSLSEFWDTPLFMIIKLIGTLSEKDEKMSRKQLVDNWRILNAQFGNT